MISYTANFKISTVKRFRASGESQAGFAERSGISRSSLRIWVARFQSAGAKGVRKQKTGLNYDAQFKFKALTHLWNNSLSYATTERLFDIRTSGLLAKWEQRYLSSGMSGLRRRARGISNSMPSTKTNVRSSVKEGQAVVDEIAALGGRALLCVADVTDQQAVVAMMAKIHKEWGRLDILVNNAAIRHEAKVEDISAQDWHDTLAVILDGAFFCTQAALALLRKSDRAAIVNIGGMTAHTGAANRAGRADTGARP